MQDSDDYVTNRKNFQYWEFLASNHPEILNTPNEQQRENIRALVKEVLDPVRDTFGKIRITSGFRSPELNAAVHGSPNSNHMRGEAADFESAANPRVPLLTIFEWINDNCSFRELIAEAFPNGWIHVAYRENGNNGQIKLSTNGRDCRTATLEEVRDQCNKNASGV